MKTAGDLDGMRSYVIGYVDTTTGIRTFTVHCYIDDDGNVGASGLLDPKWLYEDGVVYTSNRRGGITDDG